MRVRFAAAGFRFLLIVCFALAGRVAALPLSFERNEGQLDGSATFIARQSGADVLLTKDGFLIGLKNAPAESAENGERKLLRLRWIGGAAKQIAGVTQLPGRANYFRGRDRASWRAGIPTYAKVKYSRVYPGIDVVYYGNQDRLEYDFVVAPGADPGRIRLAVEGVTRMEIGGGGELVLQVGERKVTQLPPRIYQEVGGIRRAVRGHYRLTSGNELAFQLADYDRRRRLVIDPVIDFSTYVGGTGFDYVRGVATDSLGNVYLVGETGSFDLPVTDGAVQPTYAGGPSDAFVMKLSPDGLTAIYTTYLGGSRADVGYGIGVDALGQAYLTGYTVSADFPLVNPRQDTLGGGADTDAYDAFVAKLDASGSRLIYSTYLGGSAADVGKAIAVDGVGIAYIAGWTSSNDFPVTPNAFQTSFGGPFADGFVARLNPDGSEYFYVTYFGGRLYDAASGIATDGDGNAYVVGETGSPDFPTREPMFPTIAGGGGEFGDEDAFLAKFSWDGSLIYSTFLGGRDVDRARAVAVDRWGNAYVTGDTVSSDFPTVNAVQPARAGSADAFVAKVNVEGTCLVYSTYLGGTRLDQGYGIAVDGDGAATVTGSTSSSDFPIAAAVQDANGGADDVFVSRLDPSGSALIFSTYLGGRGQDVGSGVVLTSGGDPVIVGSTASPDFPTRHSVQASLLGSPNGFAAKLGSAGN